MRHLGLSSTAARPRGRSLTRALDAPPQNQTKQKTTELSLRLGLGKSGLTMAAEEDLARVLGVNPGCVTPLALAHDHPSARDVLALFDHRLRPSADASAAADASSAASSAAPRFFAHPAVNTSSVALDAQGLERFLAAAGRDPVRHAWTDLEVVAAVGRDSPGDLKPHLDGVPVPEAPPAGAAAPEGPSSSSAGPKVAAAAAAQKGKGGKGGKAAAGDAKKEDAEAAAARQLLELTDVRARADELLGLASQALLGKDLASSGLEGSYALSRLRADFEAALGALKNAAHAGGRAAARGEAVAAALGTYVK